MKAKNLELKKEYLILILLLLYLLVRILTLFSVNLYNGEECRVGTITNEIIKGPTFPLLDYPYFFGSSGRIVEGFLAVPFYLIFGISGISLKFMYLTISAILLILVYLFLDKFFDKKVAILACLLMIFSPVFYSLVTLNQSGPLLIGAFFDLLIMFIFFQIFYNKKYKPKYFIGLGLISGFAIFVNLISLIMIFTSILFWFVFDKRFILRKYFFIYILFFLIGISPWVYFNINYNSMGLVYGGEHFYNIFITEGISIDKIPQILIKFKNLVSFDLPKSFMFDRVYPSNENLFLYPYYFIVCVSFILLLYLNRKSFLKLFLSFVRSKRGDVLTKEIKGESFILAYPIIFTIVYLFSSFSINHRRFMTDSYRFLIILYIFIFIIISLFIVRLWNEKTKISKMTRVVSISFLFILIGEGILVNVGLISFNTLGKDFVYKPYCYDQLNVEGRAIKQCDKLKGGYESQCLMGGNALIWGFLDHLSIESIIKHCDTQDFKYRKFCYRGLGRIIARNKNISNAILQCNKITSKYRPYCFEGLGIAYGEGIIRYVPNYDDIKLPSGSRCDRLNGNYKAYCYIGVGESVGMNWGSNPVRAIEICNSFDQNYISYCFEGFFRSVGLKLGDFPLKASKFCEVDSRYKTGCYRGLGFDVGLMWGHNLTQANRRCDSVEEEYRGNCLEGLQEFLN
jgi:4-amino-4-deoxy-L-arabinose transferase-like glycosyltransferase